MILLLRKTLPEGNCKISLNYYYSYLEKERKKKKSTTHVFIGTQKVSQTCDSKCCLINAVLEYQKMLPLALYEPFKINNKMIMYEGIFRYKKGENRSKNLALRCDVPFDQ